MCDKCLSHVPSVTCGLLARWWPQPLTLASPADVELLSQVLTASRGATPPRQAGQGGGAGSTHPHSDSEHGEQVDLTVIREASTNYIQTNTTYTKTTSGLSPDVCQTQINSELGL